MAMPRVYKQFTEEILPALKKELGRDNPMSMPKMDKIVLSMGMGKALGDAGTGNKSGETKRFQEAVQHMTIISGQKPQICKAKKSVSNFKVREGWDTGLKVTLRGHRMYEFLDRLIAVAVPRIRDFRGLNPNSFDGRGNYGMGLTEVGVFPEINPDRVSFQQGMNITICTTAHNDAEARKLLTLLGMPFKN